MSFLSLCPIGIEDEKNTRDILVKNSQKNAYINYKTQSEEAEAYITETFIIPKEIFLTMLIQHNNSIITIINQSNLPIHFNGNIF